MASDDEIERTPEERAVVEGALKAALKKTNAHAGILIVLRDMPEGTEADAAWAAPREFDAAHTLAIINSELGRVALHMVAQAEANANETVVAVVVTPKDSRPDVEKN